MATSVNDYSDVARPTTIEEISDILSATVKRDKPTKIITFLTMLTAYTDQDQGNICFQAESSTGKSYIPLELSQLFPEEDLMILASASPTAFFHDAGFYNKETKQIWVDLERKILIFLDQPHFMLLERLRPLLSHDKKELHYKITDKTTKGGIRTKNVIIVGFPVVLFCSSRMNPDEQEKTRFFLLSPETSQDKLRDSIFLLAKKIGNRKLFQNKLDEDPRRTWLKTRVDAIKKAGIENIIIPDEDKIAQRFLQTHLYLSPRQQRDFPRLMALIKAHALLNWAHREKTDDCTIIANEDDVDVAFKLYEEVAKPNELGVAPQIYEIYQNVIAPLLNDGAEVTRQSVADAYYRLYRRVIPDWRLRQEVIPQLCQAGLIGEKENPNNRREKVLYTPVSLTISSGEYSEKNTGATPPDKGLIERLEAYIAERHSVGYQRVMSDLGLTLEQLHRLVASSKRLVWGSGREDLNWRGVSYVE